MTKPITMGQFLELYAERRATYEAMRDMDPAMQGFRKWLGLESQIDRLLGPDRGE